MDYSVFARTLEAHNALTASEAMLADATPARRKTLEKRIRKQQTLVEQLYQEALDVVNAIDDPVIQGILLLRCLKGLRWEDVGYGMDMKPDAAQQRFLRWKKANHIDI